MQARVKLIDVSQVLITQQLDRAQVSVFDSPLPAALADPALGCRDGL